MNISRKILITALFGAFCVHYDSAAKTQLTQDELRALRSKSPKKIISVESTATPTTGTASVLSTPGGASRNGYYPDYSDYGGGYGYSPSSGYSGATPTQSTADQMSASSPAYGPAAERKPSSSSGRVAPSSGGATAQNGTSKKTDKASKAPSKTPKNKKPRRPKTTLKKPVKPVVAPAAPGVSGPMAAAGASGTPVGPVPAPVSPLVEPTPTSAPVDPDVSGPMAAAGASGTPVGPVPAPVSPLPTLRPVAPMVPMPGFMPEDIFPPIAPEPMPGESIEPEPSSVIVPEPEELSEELPQPEPQPQPDIEQGPQPFLGRPQQQFSELGFGGRTPQQAQRARVEPVRSRVVEVIPEPAPQRAVERGIEPQPQRAAPRGQAQRVRVEPVQQREAERIIELQPQRAVRRGRAVVRPAQAPAVGERGLQAERARLVEPQIPEGRAQRIEPRIAQPAGAAIIEELRAPAAGTAQVRQIPESQQVQRGRVIQPQPQRAQLNVSPVREIAPSRIMPEVSTLEQGPRALSSASQAMIPASSRSGDLVPTAQPAALPFVPSGRGTVRVITQPGDLPVSVRLNELENLNIGRRSGLPMRATQQPVNVPAAGSRALVPVPSAAQAAGELAVIRPSSGAIVPASSQSSALAPRVSQSGVLAPIQPRGSMRITTEPASIRLSDLSSRSVFDIRPGAQGSPVRSVTGEIVGQLPSTRMVPTSGAQEIIIEGVSQVPESWGQAARRIMKNTPGLTPFGKQMVIAALLGAAKGYTTSQQRSDGPYTPLSRRLLSQAESERVRTASGVDVLERVYLDPGILGMITSAQQEMRDVQAPRMSAASVVEPQQSVTSRMGDVAKGAAQAAVSGVVEQVSSAVNRPSARMGSVGKVLRVEDYMGEQEPFKFYDRYLGIDRDRAMADNDLKDLYSAITTQRGQLGEFAAWYKKGSSGQAAGWLRKAVEPWSNEKREEYYTELLRGYLRYYNLIEQYELRAQRKHLREPSQTVREGLLAQIEQQKMNIMKELQERGIDSASESSVVVSTSLSPQAQQQLQEEATHKILSDVVMPYQVPLLPFPSDIVMMPAEERATTGTVVAGPADAEDDSGSEYDSDSDDGPPPLSEPDVIDRAYRYVQELRKSNSEKLNTENMVHVEMIESLRNKPGMRTPQDLQAAQEALNVLEYDPTSIDAIDE